MVHDAQRRVVSDQVESELTALFRRIRSFSFAVAADVHPGLEPASYGLMGLIHEAGSLRGSDLVERLGL
ncbi:MAG: MarR family transcriptional regulator, partial [Pseudonocardiaceae bacterium]|nr:MarR family transcriptional regulator [Pseudonocardiaceae bacterium]